MEPWTVGAPGGGRSVTVAESPRGTTIFTVVQTDTIPPCRSHWGFAVRKMDTVEAADPAQRRNMNTLNTRNPARTVARKREGTESRNHAQVAAARIARKKPCVQRVAFTIHGTSTRSSTSPITCAGVISLISASLVRMIRCRRTRGASNLMSSGTT